MPSTDFKPGFRLSALDVGVLIGGTALSYYLWHDTSWMGFVVAFVVGHFFLFCNVFRISRPLELIWSAVFVALAGATLIASNPEWVATAVASLVTTVIVVLIEMRRPSYHGICWQWVNPGLPQWWAARTSSE